MKSLEPVSSALWFCCLLVLALSLRVVALGKRSFWLDEATSCLLAQCDWHTFVTALYKYQANMALYYFLLRWWAHFGNSEAWLRLLSVLFGVAAIPLLYKLGQVVFDTRTARIAALLMTVHVLHIQFSQEARGYSLEVFLAILSGYLFVSMLVSSSRRIVVAYILASALLVYAHLFGVLLLAAEWSCAVVLSHSTHTNKRVGIAAMLICILVAPLIFSLLVVSDRTQLSWISRVNSSSLYQFANLFSGNGGMVLLILYISLLCSSLWSHLRRSKESGRVEVNYSFVWMWLVLPMFVVGAISRYHPILQSRYLLFCLPPFLLIASDGLVQIKSRLIFFAALVSISCLSAFGLTAYFAYRVDQDHSDDWRDATSYCLSHMRSGDAVLFTYSSEEMPFRAYERRIAAHPGSVPLLPQQTDLELLSTKAKWANAADAHDAMAHATRIWVVTALQPNEHSNETKEVLKTKFHQQLTQKFGFVVVQLFVPA